MTIEREVYRITIHPRTPTVEDRMRSAIKLAKMIINRWMPNQAGGAMVVMLPKLAEGLLPYFGRSTDSVIEVNTMSAAPTVTEITT